MTRAIIEEEHFHGVPIVDGEFRREFPRPGWNMFVFILLIFSVMNKVL